MTPTWDRAGDALARLQGRRIGGELLVLLWRLRFVERSLLGPLLGLSPSYAAAQVADILVWGLLTDLPATTRFERSSALLRPARRGVPSVPPPVARQAAVGRGRPIR